jgi:hypothetical protein
VTIGAAAQNHLLPEQQPPVERQMPPVDETPELQKCVTDEGGFRQQGNKALYVIALSNACETRQHCAVSAYIITSDGPKQGRATLTLEPKSHGKAARASYSLPLKSAGGMANVSRSCKAI